MVAVVAGGAPVKGARFLPTMRLPPGVRTPRKQVHRDSLPSSKSAVAFLTSEIRTPQKEVHHEVYLRQRPLLSFSVVHTNIPLRLPLRNVIRKSSIYRRSIVASVPLFLTKATKAAGAWLLLRPQRCTVATVVSLFPAKAGEVARAWLLLRR